MQTALAGAGPPPLPPPRSERWTTSDGDFVKVHIFGDAPTKPRILLLHGLEGGLGSRYVAEAATQAAARGWELALLEFRSCSGEPNLLPRSYHSGETGDFDFVLRRLAAQRPDQPLCALGVSLGGNVLLKALGEMGGRTPPQLLAAAAMSPPYDLRVSAIACDRRYGGAIARHFLRTLIPKAVEKARRFPGLLEERAVLRCRTFAAFDDLVTAPLHGFAGAEDYWRRSSCAQFLPEVAVPTLLLSAADDPLAPAATLPRAAVAQSRALVAAFSPRGGHCGFIAGGPPWRPRRWAEAQAFSFFADRCGA